MLGPVYEQRPLYAAASVSVLLGAPHVQIQKTLECTVPAVMQPSRNCRHTRWRTLACIHSSRCCVRQRCTACRAAAACSCCTVSRSAHQTRSAPITKHAMPQTNVETGRQPRAASSAAASTLYADALVLEKPLQGSPCSSCSRTRALSVARRCGTSQMPLRRRGEDYAVGRQAR